MQYELDMPQVFTSTSDFTVAPGSSMGITVSPTTPYNGNSPSQTGLLVMYTDAKAGQETSLIIVNR
jgi:hypothetical protein